MRARAALSIALALAFAVAAACAPSSSGGPGGGGVATNGSEDDDAGVTAYCDAGPDDPSNPKPLGAGDHGGAGARATVWGSNLDPTKHAFQVEVGGVPATFVPTVPGLDKGAPGEVLAFLVPEDAPPGPNRVTLSWDGCNTWTSPLDFLVDPVPAAVIDSVSPTTLSKGDVLWIRGRYLSGQVTISLGPEEVEITLDDDSAVAGVVESPPGTWPVVVITDSGMVVADGGLVVR
jgi:hypothetical protein